MESYRIITRHAEYSKATVIGRSGNELHLSYWSAKESRAARNGDYPWSGGVPMHVKEWISRDEIVSMVPID